MSRPKKSADARRSRHVIFRLTEEEYDRLCALAERAGLSPNELGRRLTARGLKRLVIQTCRRCDPALLNHLARMGNNLNQVVKNAHIFGRVSHRIEQLCATIDQMIAQAVEDTIDGS
jgi:AraC-like DNA-binding protein